MNEKKLSRLRRARSTRLKIRDNGALRLCVNRTPRHMYAQITTATGDRVLVSASTLEKGFGDCSKGNVDAAKMVGQRIADRAKMAGIDKVAFDRSGFRYHGRIKALADSAREAGLQF